MLAPAEKKLQLGVSTRACHLLKIVRRGDVR